eukprot:CFRG6317T1
MTSFGCPSEIQDDVVKVCQTDSATLQHVQVNENQQQVVDASTPMSSKEADETAISQPNIGKMNVTSKIPALVQEGSSSERPEVISEANSSTNPSLVDGRKDCVDPTSNFSSFKSSLAAAQSVPPYIPTTPIQTTTIKDKYPKFTPSTNELSALATPTTGVGTNNKRMASSRRLSKKFSCTSLSVSFDSPVRPLIYEEALPGSHTPPSRRGSLTVLSPLILSRRNSLEVHNSPLGTLQRRNSLEVPLDRRLSVEYRPTDEDKKAERCNFSMDDCFTAHTDDSPSLRHPSFPNVIHETNTCAGSPGAALGVSGVNIMSLDMKALSALSQGRRSVSVSPRDSIASVGSQSSLNLEQTLNASQRDSLSTTLAAASRKRTLSDSESSLCAQSQMKRKCSTSSIIGGAGRPEKLIVTYNDEESGATVTKDIDEGTEDITLACPTRSNSIVSELGDKSLGKFSFNVGEPSSTEDSISGIDDGKHSSMSAVLHTVADANS